jgi:hypothetical protein
MPSNFLAMSFMNLRDLIIDQKAFGHSSFDVPTGPFSCLAAKAMRVFTPPRLIAQLGVLNKER